MKKVNIAFDNFIYLSEQSLKQILELRNSDEIRNKMANTNIISLDEHFAFCQKLNGDPTKLYIRICVENEFLGVLSSVKNDTINHTYVPGCYFSKLVLSKYKNISVDMSAAFSYICYNKGLFYPLIYVRKDNPQAIFYNTMKLSNRIVDEDNTYYYMLNNCTDPRLQDHETILRKFDYLFYKYNMSFNL